jgi:hypothetical protein
LLGLQCGRQVLYLQDVSLYFFYNIYDLEYVHALMYSSCAFSRASRASSADRYSASGLLMAAEKLAPGQRIEEYSQSISWWFAT